MFRCYTLVKFQQRPNKGDLTRNKTFHFDFVHEFEATNTWVNLTNTLKITFPKNIYVTDSLGNKVLLGGTNSPVQVNELFQRGDAVELTYGYYTYDEQGNQHLELPNAPIFQGFIAKVTSKKPIQLECEDNMWVLKQVPAKPQTWPKMGTVENLMRSLLAGVTVYGGEQITVNALTETTIGNFVIQNESVAQIIMRLRKDYHLEAYFRGAELRIGSIVYVPTDAVKHNFVFQQNIISDSLDFQRREDIKLSIVAESINVKDTGKLNKQGQEKTKKERLMVLVYPDQNGNYLYNVKKQNVDFPANDEGERRKIFINDATSAFDLATRGAQEMNKYYYSGFRGKFTTFAIPYVKFGDYVRITDRLMPDRNGTYVVRGVTYKGGVSGHRQEITLDYLVFDANDNPISFPPPKLAPQ